MTAFLIALQFLTVLPVKIASKARGKDFGKSLLYFPFIGLLIGLLLAVSLSLLHFLPFPVAILSILIISILITGGIHIDAFADTCDGFYGGRRKEDILKIMRDPHIGTMGVIGIICLLLLKFTVLMSIPREAVWKTLITMTIFARWAQVFSCYAAGYARKEGKAKYFIEHVSGKDVATGGLFTLALFLLLSKMAGIILFAASSVPILFFIHWAKRKIGGMTGDTLGAASETAEVSVLLLSLILA